MAVDLTAYRIGVRRGAGVAPRPRTSIIALVTNDTTMLSRCLRTVEGTLPADDAAEVIVLANGTPAPALAGLEHGENIVLISSPVNHGFAGGCNLAVRWARGERLVFLNDDVTVREGWLEGLHGVLDRDADTAVAGSRVILSGGRLQEAGSVLWRDGSTSGIGRGHDPQARRYSAPRIVDYVSFCSAMVRRSAWEEAGGFDERYFPAYYEDLDLCLTLNSLGWKVMYEPASVVEHDEGGSAARHLRDFLSRRNQARFVAKWSSVLDGYENPPTTETDRADAEDRALGRAARRRWPARAGTAGAVPTAAPAAVDSLDDAEALAIEVRHLAARVAVSDEYIGLLLREAARRGVRDVVRARFAGRVMQVRQRLRRLGATRRSHRGSG